VEGKLLTMKEWEEVARKADYNPGKMAALCSISERQMQRLFQQHVKCTPSRWLRQLQCRLAKQLISQGYSNKAVAAELKFSSNPISAGSSKRSSEPPPRTLPVPRTATRRPRQRFPARAGPPWSTCRWACRRAGLTRAVSEATNWPCLPKWVKTISL
jgi:AraC-like DNA-binding protein